MKKSVDCKAYFREALMPTIEKTLYGYNGTLLVVEDINHMNM